MGRMFLISFSRCLLSSSSSRAFSVSRRFRSSFRSFRVVSNRSSRSPFFTVSPSETATSVTVWVSDRNTVWIRSVETGP